LEKAIFENPFRPGAGHMPPYLAGRGKETEEFNKLLKQKVILQNAILTGLRGVGKTVLLDTFKPLALRAGWRWAGADLSESASVNEMTIATRLIADLSIVTSDIVFQSEQNHSIGFNREEKIINKHLNYEVLSQIFTSIPGLVLDKLKGTLEVVWNCMQNKNIKGIVFSYDEAQTMSNYAQKEQYPLSLLLDTFQSLQKKSIPFMLLLTGLPTLFPKLVEARTFAERMFRVIFLAKLNEKDSRAAITIPIEKEGCPVRLSEDSIKLILKVSAGYPYFIQFICKEAYDIFVQQHKKGKLTGVPVDEITRKLDNDFFAGRWAKATDRQRDLLRIIANLPNADEEFTVLEIVEKVKKSLHPFGSSQTNQMLAALANKGLVYRNRHGKYSFAVPLLGQYILREASKKTEPYFWDIKQIKDLT
jgi:hypothetical protein